MTTIFKSDGAGGMGLDLNRNGTSDFTADSNGNKSIGDGTNKLVISSSGVVTMEGTAKRTLITRPTFDVTQQISHAKPSQVELGVASVYSLPVYNSDNEELFFREIVPGRWDGASNITFCVIAALSGAEDVGDKFNLQFSWEHQKIGEPFKVTSNDVPIETIILTDHAAQYDTYCVEFPIDYDIDTASDLILARQPLFGRLRRIAATSLEVTNEILITNWYVKYTVDKILAA
jgi:hypothetical protein